jgi:hypothetical protein
MASKVGIFIATAIAGLDAERRAASRKCRARVSPDDVLAGHDLE